MITNKKLYIKLVKRIQEKYNVTDKQAERMALFIMKKNAIEEELKK